MSPRGQALVELAVCMPVVMLLGLGAAGSVEVADAASGLRAATEAAVAVAVRESSPAAATSVAEQRFRAVVAAYPVRDATFVLANPGFERGDVVTARRPATSISAGRRCRSCRRRSISPRRRA